MHRFSHIWALCVRECLIAVTAATTKDFFSLLGGVVYLARYLPKQVSFAVIRGDGSVTTWGDEYSGG